MLDTALRKGGQYWARQLYLVCSHSRLIRKRAHRSLGSQRQVRKRRGALRLLINPQLTMIKLICGDWRRRVELLLLLQLDNLERLFQLVERALRNSMRLHALVLVLLLELEVVQLLRVDPLHLIFEFDNLAVNLIRPHLRRLLVLRESLVGHEPRHW